MKVYFFIATMVAALLSCNGTKKIDSSQVASGQTSVEISPSTALQSYLQNGDSKFTWKVVDSYTVGKVKAVDILLTSQQWREHIWKHQLTLLVPQDIQHTSALLRISGGSIKDGLPNFKPKDDRELAAFAKISNERSAIVSILRQTPNQPLYDGFTEDQLISYTLHMYRGDGDYSWPLLFPMVKSAVRAMDAVQEYSQKMLDISIDDFLVSGESKRGWTTWLTGASDRRVHAIAPMVIDVLNMSVSLDYQLEVWQEYSIQIEDYVKLGIAQAVNTSDGSKLTQMIDPFSYREKLTMPKMIFIGTNDEYWPIDAIKNYYSEIPGQNTIHYVPNVGHGLGDKEQSLNALSAFWGITMTGESMPKCNWQIQQITDGVKLSVEATGSILEEALLWYADSDDRDFRDEKFTSVSLGFKHQNQVNAEISFPPEGFAVFYIDLRYKSPDGTFYTESTRTFVLDDDEIL